MENASNSWGGGVYGEGVLEVLYTGTGKHLKELIAEGGVDCPAFVVLKSQLLVITYEVMILPRRCPCGNVGGLYWVGWLNKRGCTNEEN